MHKCRLIKLSYDWISDYRLVLSCFFLSFAFSSCHGGYAYIFFICICFCVCDRFRFTRPWATTFRLRGLCMLGTCLSVAGPRKFASSASVRIFIVRTWWMCVRAQTGPRFIALIRRSLGSGVCTTVNSKWLSHFLTQRPKLGSNPWPLDYQSGALTNWDIVPPFDNIKRLWRHHEVSKHQNASRVRSIITKS